MKFGGKDKRHDCSRHDSIVENSHPHLRKVEKSLTACFFGVLFRIECTVSKTSVRGHAERASTEAA